MIPLGDRSSPSPRGAANTDSATARPVPGPSPARHSRAFTFSLILQQHHEDYKIKSILSLLQKMERGRKVTSQLRKPSSRNEHPARTTNILILGILCLGPQESWLQTQPMNTFLPYLSRACKRELQRSATLF